MVKLKSEHEVKEATIERLKKEIASLGKENISCVGNEFSIMKKYLEAMKSDKAAISENDEQSIVVASNNTGLKGDNVEGEVVKNSVTEENRSLKEDDDDKSEKYSVISTRDTRSDQAIDSETACEESAMEENQYEFNIEDSRLIECMSLLAHCEYQLDEKENQRNRSWELENGSS